ncbi:protein FAM71C-like [Sceloporus undulatus]|uniref:protein FAM71C-like n=1 Tax=Sceloporus undulatus TaxID=8520 RepID=UPI001C4AE8C6|nr:protein FAM71C-like [Sceloporus undulatus]
MPRLKKGSRKVHLPELDREIHTEISPSYSGNPLLKLFHRAQPSISFSSLTQTPIKTVLQKYLWKGEYPSFQSVPMFESCFHQVTRRGRHVFIHNHSNEAIIGIASTNVKLPLPNLMFVARPVVGPFSSGPHTGEPMLTRLLPLKFVRISIHDPEKHLIKIKLINGRTYYLQLHAPTEEEEAQFDRWLSLVYLLHHPPACYLQPKPMSCTIIDNLSIELIPSEEEDEDWKDQKGKKPPAEQKRFSIEQEEYTDEEREILQAKPSRIQSERHLYVHEGSYETYKGSSIKARSSRSSR